jgi:hypothetical protein
MEGWLGQGDGGDESFGPFAMKGWRLVCVHVQIDVIFTKYS